MRIICVLALGCAWMLWVSFSSAENTGTLNLIVRNVEAEQGSLHIALYQDESAFLKEGQDLVKKIMPVSSKPDCIIPITQLPFGSYAVAIFHDLNGNGKLDKNTLGIPTEPYAFSNNPSVKWRSPTFAETLIKFGESRKEIVMELKRWRKH